MQTPNEASNMTIEKGTSIVVPFNPVSMIWTVIKRVTTYAVQNVQETAILSMLLSPVIPRLFGFVRNTVNSYLWSYLQFRSNQKEYKAVMFYLSEILEGRDIENKNNHFHTLAIGDSIIKYYQNPTDLQKQREKIRFVPGIGTHKIYFKGHTLYVSVYTSKDGNLSCGEIEISTRFRRTHILKEFTEFAQQKYNSTHFNSTMIYKPELLGGYWNAKTMKPKRSLKTVVLQDGIMNELIKDIEHFKSEKTRKFYNDFGYSYSRTYLLYGPPGTGKSSTIRALASYFDLDIFTLNLANKELTDSMMEELFTTLPPGALLLLEDVDAVVSKRENDAENNEVEDDARSTSPECSVSMTSLLNSLDGVESNEDRIIFMTSNRYDLLRKEKRLIRPGRVDRIFEIRYADKMQVEQIYNNVFGAFIDRSQVEKFGTLFSEKLISMGSYPPSMIKEYLLPYAIDGDLQGSIENIKNIDKER